MCIFVACVYVFIVPVAFFYACLFDSGNEFSFIAVFVHASDCVKDGGGVVIRVISDLSMSPSLSDRWANIYFIWPHGVILFYRLCKGDFFTVKYLDDNIYQHQSVKHPRYRNNIRIFINLVSF